jgi:hypothetical protein
MSFSSVSRLLEELRKTGKRHTSRDVLHDFGEGESHMVEFESYFGSIEVDAIVVVKLISWR